MNFSSLPALPILDASGKQRRNHIFSGFVSDYARYIGVKLVGYRLFGRSAPKAVIDMAVQSATKPSKNGLQALLKRHFLIGQSRWAHHFFRQHKRALFVVWNGTKGNRMLLANAAEHCGHTVYYFEEAPLPKRITIDTKGVNYGSSLPRDPRFYQVWAAHSGIAPDAWRQQGADLLARQSNRSDVGQGAAASDLTRENYIFCPLQVPGDSQITIYGDWIKSVEHMIRELHTASQSLPDGWHLRIKEHPSAKIAFSDLLNGLQSDKFRIDNTTDTFEQVASSRAVLNVNSSVGLQSFFYDKPVIVLGQAFYDMPGLTHRAASLADLQKLLSAPTTLSFNAELRNAFMNYLDAEYYPYEEDVKSGKFTVKSVEERDKRRDDILGLL